MVHPREREGRDEGHGRILERGRVSIHAPARGATGPAYTEAYRMRCFNPRAREGRDTGSRLRSMPMPVSIHAPARGATPSKWGAHWKTASFNPRAREGRDLTIKRNITGDPAPARGATPPNRRAHLSTASFNPRAREGRDAEIHQVRYRLAWFQSTRPRGARPFETPAFSPARPVSIHAPARGATLASSSVRGDSGVSIHAPARGATLQNW